MPSKRKRIRQEDREDEDVHPSKICQHSGIEDSLEDDVPVAEAAPPPPMPRKKLRRAHEAAADGAQPRRQDRGHRAPQQSQRRPQVHAGRRLAAVPACGALPGSSSRSYNLCLRLCVHKHISTEATTG